jgi:O-antigen/teichoic acid export membrane protein
VTTRKQAREVLRLPLVRTTAALVVNTGVNAVLGLAYWVVAARLYDAAIVGRGAGAVSAVMFVGSLGWIGLQQVLLRYVPTAGRAAGRIIAGTYAAAALVASLGAVGFLAYARTQPDLAFLVADGGAIAAFLGAVLVWVVFSLQDPALIGLGRAGFVPVENLAFGSAKLALLVVLAATGSPWGILGSWVLGCAWLVVVVNALVRREIQRADVDGQPDWRRIGRFALGQHAIAVTMAAPDSLAPLIVLGLLGDSSTAFYYAAWTISFSVRLLAVNLGSAVTVQGSRDGPPTSTHRRHVGRIAVAVIVPAVVATALLAELAMALYGPRYRESAADLLRLLAIAVLPYAAVTLFVVGERIAERTAAALTVVVTATGATLALDVLLLPRLGLAGAGVATLGAQLLALVVAGLILARRQRASRAGTSRGAKTVG